MNTYRRNVVWIISTLVLMSIIFILFVAVTVYIDPLFHYHGPLEQYEYPLDDPRYQNDGITRNFVYDSIITGTSMTENFMVSEANQIFGADFIKVPFSGAYYKEINDNLVRGYDAGKEIRYVIRCLDYSRLVQDKDIVREDIEYPVYLYNSNLFDDVNYVLNKSVLLNRTWDVIRYTASGNKTTDFDAYTNWNAGHIFGEKAVLASYVLGEKAEETEVLTEDDRLMIVENIRQNVTDLAYAHPETTFYLFFPPYSICYWDALKNDGQVDWHIDAEETAIKEMVQCPNIKLFSFCNNFELVCNLENYKDQAHYGEWVNSWLLEWMYKEEYLLTEKNYREYIHEIRDFYNSYPYDSLHE